MAVTLMPVSTRFDGGVKGELHRRNAVPAAPVDGQELAVAFVTRALPAADI